MGLPVDPALLQVVISLLELEVFRLLLPIKQDRLVLFVGLNLSSQDSLLIDALEPLVLEYVCWTVVGYRDKGATSGKCFVILANGEHEE